MIFLRLIVLFFPAVFLMGKVLVVPDYEGYVKTMFPKTVSRSQYGNYGVWGKIKVLFQEAGEEICGASLREYLKVPESIGARLEADGVQRIVFINIPNYIGPEELKWFPKDKLVLMMYEPPTVIGRLYDPNLYSLFGRVLTWQDDLIDNRKLFKMFYPVHLGIESALVPFNQRRLVCAISRNKSSHYADEIYSERVRAIKYFGSTGEFDLYGYGWETEGYSCYRGSIQDKYAALRQYKFSICYENTKDIKGYITEKIFDCFRVGTIPIYLGASNIADYIPQACYIDRREFSDYKALHRYLKEMSEEQYTYHLNAIKKYLKSQQSTPFTDEAFISNFTKTACLLV